MKTIIDKILPCPECGDYPDFNVTEPSVNRYKISINCYCKETCEAIDRLEEEQKDLISLIVEWNEFAEANETIKILKNDLKYIKHVCDESTFRVYHISNLKDIFKKYLPEEKYTDD